MPLPKTILFVEDSDIERTVYSHALKKAGYDVHAAKDGMEAMRQLHTHVPSLVLLDLLLPRFDGVEVLKFMRKDSRLREVPVIIFSTNSIIEAQDEPLLEMTAKRILKYKCTPRLLLQSIQEVLGDKPAGALPETAVPEDPNVTPAAA